MSTLLQETSISKATAYLQSQIEELSHPYAVAITAYYLSEGNGQSRAWQKLQSMVKRGMYSLICA